MTNNIIYDAKGRIISVGTCQKNLLEAQITENPLHVGFYVLEGIASLYLDWINDGEVQSRPTQLTSLNKLTLATDGVDVIILSNVPIGTFTAINTVTGETISGDINDTDTFSTTIPGTYKIKIESFPYLDFETTIEAI